MHALRDGAVMVAIILFAFLLSPAPVFGGMGPAVAMGSVSALTAVVAGAAGVPLGTAVLGRGAGDLPRRGLLLLAI